MYALANKIWMVFLGLGARGTGAAFCSAIIHTYIGELGTQMDEIRKKQHKKPRKVFLYIAYSFLLNGGFIISYSTYVSVPSDSQIS